VDILFWGYGDCAPAGLRDIVFAPQTSALRPKGSWVWGAKPPETENFYIRNTTFFHFFADIG